jgi:hypothetical protein
MLVTRFEWLDNARLRKLLTRSFKEFNVKDPKLEHSIFQKYSTAVDQNQAAGLELFEQDTRCFSYDELSLLLLNSSPLKLSFSLK